MKVDVAAVAQNGSSAAAPGRPASDGGDRGAVITAWVVIAVGALTGLTLWGQFTSGASTGMLVLDVSVGVASCALMPVTLRWPVAGALVLSVLAAVSARRHSGRHGGRPVRRPAAAVRGRGRGRGRGGDGTRETWALAAG